MYIPQNKTGFSFFLVLAFVLITYNASSQTCYELSLKDVITDLNTKNFQKAQIGINNIKKYCTDIPKVNVLDSLSILIADSVNKRYIEKLKPAENVLLLEICKRYGLDWKEDSIQTKTLEWDFNNDRMSDKAIIFSFVKKPKNKSSKIIPFMGIAVFLQTNSGVYLWPNPTKTPNILAIWKVPKSVGIETFIGYWDGLFKFHYSNNIPDVGFYYDILKKTIEKSN